MAIRYTKQQKASPFFEEYKKERARIQGFARSAKARGIELPENFVPSVPQKITAGSVRKLQRITPEHGYYERATFRAVNRFTGEVIESSRGSATSVNRAISRFRQSIMEALEPTTPLSRGRLQEIVNDFTTPDVFSTARHKSVLRQIENRNTKEGLRELAEKLSESSTEDTTSTEDTSTEESYADYWNSLTPEQRELEYRGFERDEERQKKVEQVEAEDLSEPAIGQDSTFSDEDFTVVDEGLSVEDTPFGDSIDIDEQARKLDAAMNKAISYVEDEVSAYWAEKLQQALDNIKNEYGADPAFMALADDSDFWEYIGDMVQANYGRGANFPSAIVRGMIEERLTGSPPTMEDNARLNEDQLADSGDSFYI